MHKMGVTQSVLDWLSPMHLPLACVWKEIHQFGQQCQALPGLLEFARVLLSTLHEATCKWKLLFHEPLQPLPGHLWWVLSSPQTHQQYPFLQWQIHQQYPFLQWQIHQQYPFLQGRFSKKLPDLKLVYVWHWGHQKAWPSVRLAMFMGTEQQWQVSCWARRPFSCKKDMMPSVPPKMTGPSCNRLIIVRVAIIKTPTVTCHMRAQQRGGAAWYAMKG